MYKIKKYTYTSKKGGIKMKTLNLITLTLVIIGAINWLLVGLFKFNLVDAIFGSLSAITRIIYILVGISGLWAISFFSKIAD